MILWGGRGAEGLKCRHGKLQEQEAGSLGGAPERMAQTRLVLKLGMASRPSTSFSNGGCHHGTGMDSFRGGMLRRGEPLAFDPWAAQRDALQRMQSKAGQVGKDYLRRLKGIAGDAAAIAGLLLFLWLMVMIAGGLDGG